MKRGTSTGAFILAGLWLILALIWYIPNRNIATGTVWFCAALIELVIALIQRKKEKDSDRQQ